MIVRTFTNSFGLLVGDLGLEPRSQLRRRIYEIKEKHCGTEPFTRLAHWKRVTPSGAFTNSASLPIWEPKSFADLRHTTHDLQPYSISRETRSEHWVATPILPAPIVPIPAPERQDFSYHILRRTVCLQLSPAIQNLHRHNSITNTK